MMLRLGGVRTRTRRAAIGRFRDISETQDHSPMWRDDRQGHREPVRRWMPQFQVMPRSVAVTVPWTTPGRRLRAFLAKPNREYWRDESVMRFGGLISRTRGAWAGQTRRDFEPSVSAFQFPDRSARQESPGVEPQILHAMRSGLVCRRRMGDIGMIQGGAVEPPLNRPSRPIAGQFVRRNFARRSDRAGVSALYTTPMPPPPSFSMTR